MRIIKPRTRTYKSQIEKKEQKKNTEVAKDSASVDRLNDLFGDENNLKKKKTSGRPYKRKQRNSGEQGVPKKRAASLDNSFMFTSTPMCTIIEEDGLQENDAQTEVIEKKYLIQESIKLDDLLGMQESTVKQPASDKVIVPLAATKRAPRKSKTMTKVPKKPKSTKGKVNSSKLKPRLSSKSKIISNGTPSLVPSLPPIPTPLSSSAPKGISKSLLKQVLKNKLPQTPSDVLSYIKLKQGLVSRQILLQLCSKDKDPINLLNRSKRN